MYPPLLIDGVLARLAEEPAREALRDERGAVTRGELRAASGALAGALLRAGVRSGSRLLLGLPPDRRFVTTFLAALRLGVPVVPVHPKAKPREVQHLLWDAAPRAVVADAALADLVATTSPATRILDLERLPEPPANESGIELSHDFAGVTASADDPALLLYTSGTTGKPKGAVHTQGTLAANLASLVQAWQLSPADRLVHCLPLHHLHGLVVGLLGCLYSGAWLELLPGFEESTLLAHLADARATLFFGVPSMYARLVQASAPALPSMRLFVSGSAPLAPALKRQFEQRFGHAILERYGATEMGIALSQEVDGPRPAGRVGRPLATVETRLETASLAPDGTGVSGVSGDEGELWVKGPSLFRGYHEDEEATAKVMADGWYRTGDLVRREEDGSFRILGRISTDMIKVNGHRVGALEIEAALAEHPDVAEVAVVGAPDAEAGEVPVAFVRPRHPGVSAEELHRHAAATLAPHQVPRRVLLVDELPRTGPGKVDKRRLQARAAEPS